MAYCYTLSVNESNYKIREIIKYMKIKNRECEWFYHFYNDLFMLDTAELNGILELKSEELEFMYIYDDIFILSMQFPESVFSMRHSWDEYDESKLEEMI